MKRQRADHAEDAPLRNDIRFLGRVLGDTIREQEGKDAFVLVERVRQMSVQYHRSEDPHAQDALERDLKKLSPHAIVQVTRAFSNFSRLVNIAEDQDYVRDHRQREMAATDPYEHSMANALRHARDAGITSAQLKVFFDEALVSPVLTSHPTEVRRKSIRDRERDIARLLDDRDRLRLTRDQAASNEEAIRRAVLTIWQTGDLRRKRPGVIDEVA